MQLSLAFLSLLLGTSLALDITKPQTLAYQSEELCADHAGVHSSAINTEMSGKTLKIVPYRWNDNQTMVCNPIDYSSANVEGDIFARIIGEDIMPLVKAKNQIVLYNCTYDDGTSEPVFLLNGKETIMLDFIRGDCQITFGYNNTVDFGSMKLGGVAQNPNKCSRLAVTGKIKLTNFDETNELGDGVVDVYFQEINGTSLEIEGKDISLTCQFSGTGIYSTVICTDKMFMNNYGIFQFFYLDDGMLYFYNIDSVDPSESCWQTAFGGLNASAFGLLALGLLYWFLSLF